MHGFGLETTLVSKGYYLPEELSGFKAEALKTAEPLHQYLVRTKKMEAVELLELEAGMYGVEYWAEIPERLISDEILRTFGIRYLKRYLALPLLREDGQLVVAVGVPSSLDVLQDFAVILNKPLPLPVFASPKKILEHINRLFSISQENIRVSDLLENTESQGLASLADEDIEDLLDDSSEAPFIRLVNVVLAQAVRARASDVHIEPYRDSLRIRFRLDGILYDKHVLSKRHSAAIASRIKIMAKLNIAEKRLPQDGRMSLTLGGRTVDLRVSTIPTSFGERVVMRLLERNWQLMGINELGLGASDMETMKSVTTISNGIILVTGPTGSGKTTTLYAFLNHINSPDKNILTIEDPVEYQLDGIGQMQVNSKIGLTFASGLRSIVRQDPDVVLIGEIRDKDTADIAVQSALTGHLVFSTLHTNDAASAITRLIDMGVESFLLSSVVRVVVSQRLVRQLCDKCKEAYTPEKETLNNFSQENVSLFVGKTLYHAKGCTACNQTGYHGRTAVYEIMPISDEMQGLILRTSDSNIIRKQAIESGMKTLRMDCCLKALEGKTSLAEILRVTHT